MPSAPAPCRAPVTRDPAIVRRPPSAAPVPVTSFPSGPSATARVIRLRTIERAPRPDLLTEADFAHALSTAEPALRAYAIGLEKSRADADDLFQDVALWLIRHRRQFTPGSNFLAWARQAMRNQFLGLRRKADRRHRIAAAEGQVARWSNAHVDDRLPDAELRAEDLRRLIRGLSPVLRETFVLHAEGYTSTEIGERLGTPVGTVKSRIHHARYRLRALIVQ